MIHQERASLIIAGRLKTRILMNRKTVAIDLMEGLCKQGRLPAVTAAESQMYRLASFYCSLLYLTLQNYAFYKLKVCGNTVSSKSVGDSFPTVFAHSVSVSHFGNSQNISDFFIIIIFVMTYDQTSLMLPL